MGNLINNKIKQFAGGNWGSNKFVKKNTRILDSFFPEIPRYRSQKKKREANYEAKMYGCPFCFSILPIVTRKRSLFWGDERAKTCENCGAENKDKSCPACRLDTWFKNGIYKHRPVFLNCGFVGRKLQR